MSAFAAYIDFFALKNHFTTTYDYHKYKGKLRRKVSTFEKRPDKYLFEKLGKRKDYHEFILANLSRNPKLWIHDIVGKDEAEVRYIEWKKTMQSLSYIFEQEIKWFQDNMYESLNQYHYTAVLEAFLNRIISFETMCILLDLTDVKSVAGCNLTSNVIWVEFLEDAANYTPFLQYDKAKFRSIAYRKFKHPVFLDK